MAKANGWIMDDGRACTPQLTGSIDRSLSILGKISVLSHRSRRSIRTDRTRPDRERWLLYYHFWSIYSISPWSAWNTVMCLIDCICVLIHFLPGHKNISIYKFCYRVTVWDLQYNYYIHNEQKMQAYNYRVLFIKMIYYIYAPSISNYYLFYFFYLHNFRYISS
jgi:hypothetical protein